MAASLQSRILQQAESRPDAPALGFLGGDGNASWYTRERLCTRAGGWRRVLRDAGLGHGDVCILALPSREPCATLLTGVLACGAVPLLIAPPVLRTAESALVRTLTSAIRKTRCRLVVSDSSLLEAAPRLLTSHPNTCFLSVDEVAPTEESAGPALFEPPPEVAALQLTSGTTGFPRICVWKQEQVLASLDGMAAAMEVRAEEDICFNWTPLYHDMGLVNNFLLCLTTGVPLVMLSPQDFIRQPSSWIRGLSDTGATITWSPNFGFAIATSRIADDELDGVRLGSVRAFWNAAEKIHLETMRLFRNRFQAYGLRPTALKTNFGCAENVGGATFSDVEASFVVESIDPIALQVEGRAITGSPSGNGSRSQSVVGVGKPVPGTEVLILSRQGSPLPDGRVGEIALRTPSRMSGYLGDARASRRAIFQDLLRTGDLGYVRDGELFWVGRVRERITVLGRKLDPSDLELSLLQVDGLRQGCFAAFGIDDEESGTQRVVVVSETRPADRTADEIIRDVRDRIALDLGVRVSEVVLVPAGTLPKTTSGKRRHRRFKKLYLDGYFDGLAHATG